MESSSSTGGDPAVSVGKLARLLSEFEDSFDPSEVLDRLPELSPRIWTIGVTGPPGAGKSTLLASLVSAHRRTGHRVGVLAMDPTSTISGGALLGDRIRFRALAEEEGVFFRSVASRGHLGGLAARLPVMIRALAAHGYEDIFVETVGVGQSEVAVRDAVDTTIVVLCPGQGDAIQAAKAGVLEVADIYVVNKADLPDAASTVRDLRGSVLYRKAGVQAEGWQPSVVTTTAATGDIEKLRDQMQKHRDWLRADHQLELRRAAGVRSELHGLISAYLLDRLNSVLCTEAFQALSQQVGRGEARREDAIAVLLDAVHREVMVAMSRRRPRS
jgi:LAO/AO transport system kinase